MTITIPKAEMRELIYGNVVRTRIIGHSRWHIISEVIFERDGKLYRSTYYKGATEYQDEQPYEHDDDPIVCKEVKQVPSIDYEVIE